MRFFTSSFIASPENLSQSLFFVNLSHVDKNFALCYDFFNAVPLKAVTLEEGGEKMEIFIQLGVTVVAGALGTVLGGLILDYIRKK